MTIMMMDKKIFSPQRELSFSFMNHNIPLDFVYDFLVVDILFGRLIKKFLYFMLNKISNIFLFILTCWPVDKKSHLILW